MNQRARILKYLGRTEKPVSDIISSYITDNDTWHFCPHCQIYKKQRTPIPGLIQKTVICLACRVKFYDNNNKSKI